MSAPNRTVCDCLKEIRKLDAIKNYSSLETLIAETVKLTIRMIEGVHGNEDK